MRTKTITCATLDAFREYLHTDEKSSFTVKKYLRDTEAFRRFASGRPLTKGLTVAYKNYLVSSGKYADSSINSMIASLRGLFKFMEKGDCCVKGIRMQEEPYCPENKSLAMEEYQKLRAAAEGNDRLRMMLEVLAGTGIRISELKYFTVEALGKQGSHTSIRVSCKKKSREILIPDGLRDELCSYIKRHGITEGVIFRTRSGKPVDRSNFWKQMKRLGEKAGIDKGKVYPHNIRKLFARTFYEGSHDIAQLACLLGHSSINTTLIYVKRTEREVRVKVENMMEKILYQSGKIEKCDLGPCEFGRSESGMNDLGKIKREKSKPEKKTPHYPYNVV